ncbi:MAG: hypothetical protein PVF58_17155 [Candidatus Methanofastidiosia archaeon]|jgi:hypothetical protein
MKTERTFYHGIPYTFSVDEEKIQESENRYRKKFLEYTQTLLENRLPHGFSHPPRASKMQFPRLKCYKIDHLLQKFAASAYNVSIPGSRHHKMETFLMVSDIATVATEVPTWMTPKESQIFDSNLTGHIDVVRLTDKIEIWDYKPWASKEIFAGCQVYWYCRMLSARLHIDITQFRCGYFDRFNVYVIEPDNIPFQKTLTEYVD